MASGGCDGRTQIVYQGCDPKSAASDFNLISRKGTQGKVYLGDAWLVMNILIGIKPGSSKDKEKQGS
jgi:hypothetical protein